MEKLYRTISGLISARANCEKTGNREWFVRHSKRLLALVKDKLPSGSGFDSGTTIDVERSTPERLVFSTSYHHMNEGGMYDGWTEHEVIVTPSLHHGISVRITGRDRNQIKDFIHESFRAALTDDIDPAREFAQAGA